MAANKGVYFVANDAIHELAIAFLKSFRIHNPSIPLCLIPYDQHIHRLSQLSETYNFSILADDALFERCGRISRLIHCGTTWGHYRKLAAWHGPFDEFIYIDTDTVVTSNFGFVYDFLVEHSFVFASSDMPEIRRWVWKDSILETGALAGRQISFAANTGFFCSRKGALSIDDAEHRLPAVLAIVDHLELKCVEQPFLNYLVVTSGRSFDSIWNISMETCATHYPVERWGGQRYAFLRYENCCTPEHNVLFVHWAGEWQVTPRERRVYDFLRKVGYRGPLPSMRLFMPNRRLWRYYRHRPEHLFSRRYQPGVRSLVTQRLADQGCANQKRKQQA